MGEEVTSEALDGVEVEIKQQLEKFGRARGSSCFPFLLRSASIGNSLVDDVFDDLRATFTDCKSIDVIVDSGGGSIDAVFNIATLFRQYAQTDFAL